MYGGELFIDRETRVDNDAAADASDEKRAARRRVLCGADGERATVTGVEAVRQSGGRAILGTTLFVTGYALHARRRANDR
jgi:hypothetical protein